MKKFFKKGKSKCKETNAKEAASTSVTPTAHKNLTTILKSGKDQDIPNSAPTLGDSQKAQGDDAQAEILVRASSSSARTLEPYGTLPEPRSSFSSSPHIAKGSKPDSVINGPGLTNYLAAPEQPDVDCIKTATGVPQDIPSLSSSRLWQKASEGLKNDPDWPAYEALIRKNVSLSQIEIDHPDGVVRIASAVSEQLESSKTVLQLGGRNIVVRNVLDQTVQVLAILKDVGRSVNALIPYAAVAWGGVQFLVQAAVSHQEVRKLCWDELPRMVRLISQYQTFEQFYELSKLHVTGSHLELGLVNLFRAILKYHVVIVKYASSRTEKFKTAFQGAAKSLPQQVLNDVKLYEEEVHKLRGLADREANDMQFEALSKSLTSNKELFETGIQRLGVSLHRLEELQIRTAVQVDSISKFVEQAHRRSILDWVSTIKYATAHNSEEKSAMAGTGQWLMNHPQYTQWKLSQSPAVLYLHGSMGSGKSCLTHVVIEDIKADIASSMGKRLAYFYCVGSSAEGRSDISRAEKILCSLLRQLSHSHKTSCISTHLLKMYEETNSESDISHEQCLKCLENSINELEEATIIIDGLDECQEEVQKRLMTKIAHLHDHCTSTLRIFISSRKTNLITDLRDLVPMMIGTAINNERDIKKLVSNRVAEAVSTPGYRILYRSELRSQDDIVISTLIRNAGGMFRWVDLAFQYLHDSIDYEAMSRRLRTLKSLSSLFDLYDQMYDEMLQRLDEPDRTKIITLLTFVLYGYSLIEERTVLKYLHSLNTCGTETPQSRLEDLELGIEHVLEACSFAADGAIVAQLTSERVSAICPHLVVLEDSKDSFFGSRRLLFTFPHFSVRDWLLERRSSTFSPFQGQLRLTQICMDFLSWKARHYSASMEKPIGFENYSFQHWLMHLQCLILEVYRSRDFSSSPQYAGFMKCVERFLCGYKTMGSLHTAKSTTGLQHWHALVRAVQGEDEFVYLRSVATFSLNEYVDLLPVETIKRWKLS